MVDDVFEERNVGLDAAHAELAQAAVHALAGVVEFAAPGGHLDQQGIVIRSDYGAAVGRAAIQADAEAGGRAVGRELAVIGDEVVGGVLGGDAALHGVAVERDSVLRRQVDFGAVEFQALGHLELAADQIDTGDHFGDGVLHLDARVDLDEVPGAGIGVHQELDGAGVVVAGGAGQGDGSIGQGGASGGIQGDGGRDLHHLLMAALDGAIALVEMEDVAVAVAEDLDFDVAGAADVAFEKNGVVAESGLGFAAGFFQAAGEIGGVLDHAHAAAAAAERGFDDEGEADVPSDLFGALGIFHRLFGAGDHGDAGFLGEAAGGGLIAEQVEEIGAGADEGDAGLGAGARERGIFGEEAVAGMDGIDILLAGQGDDACDRNRDRLRPGLCLRRRGRLRRP